MNRLAAALLLATSLSWPAIGGAEPATVTPVPHVYASHFDVAAGGFLAVTGPVRYGWAAETELYPGGGFGRYGFRVDLRGFETETELSQLLVGVTYEAAATRPGLQLALHGDLGLSFPDHLPVIGGGLQVRLGVWGPLALGADSTACLVVDGADSTLVLASALTGRIGF